MTEHSAAFTVGSDHPALPGHFPGNPIVPGVVLLDHAVAVIGGGRRLRAVPTLKFLQPVRPGDPCTVLWTWSGEVARFRILSGGFERVLGSLSFSGDAG